MQKHTPGIILFLTILTSVLCPQFSSFASSPADTSKIKKDSTIVSWFYRDIEKYGNLRLHPYDTTLAGTQNYNPQYQKDYFSSSLGNIGQNYRDLVPSFLSGPSHFEYGNHTLDRYMFQNDSVKYYRMLKSFSCLEYEQGAKKEIFFRALFSRNIYKGLNLGFDFRVLNSPGFYLRERSNAINFYVTASYFTRNKRYGVVANFLINRLKNQQNGGIANDSLFEQNLEKNRLLIPVRLQTAQNRMKESGFYMNHYFNLSRHKVSAKDSLHYFELGRISYSFEYNRQIINYIDLNFRSGFYPVVYDTINTSDSLTVKRITNELTWTNPSFRRDRKFRIIQLAAHFSHHYIEFSDRRGKDYFSQFVPAAEFSFTPISSIHLEANADYIFGNYNEGDKSLNVLLNFILGTEQRNLGVISFKGNYAARKPGWFYEHYYGTTFRWDTLWQQQTFISGSCTYAFKNILDAGVVASRINHYVYLDTAAKPQQYNTQFAYLCAYLNGNLRIWRLNFKGQFAYQTVQGTTILHLPVFLGNITVYFTQPLFKGAAILQPGINVFYNTQYYSDAYMPATSSFYLQDKVQTGSYPYFDVFINVKIQHAKIFVMYNHINAGFMGRSYYMVPNYPMPDAAFRFGFSWRFHD